MAELVVVRVSLQIAWSLLSNRLAKRLNTGSYSDEALRKLLLDKFQKLHEELNALRRKELVAAVSFMENGYELFTKDPIEARKEFTKARDAAQMAFGVIAEASDKLMATKILLASVIHEFVDKVDTAITFCLKYVSRLNALAEVVDVCGTFLRKGAGSRFRAISSDKKLELLKGVSEINRNVWEYVRRHDPLFDEAKWPRVQCGDRAMNPVFELIPLRDCQVLTNDIPSTGKPIAITVCGKRVFLAWSSPNSILVADLETLQVTMLEGHSAVVLALVAAKGRLFSASYDRSILVWDVSSLAFQQKLGEHDGAVQALVANKTLLFSAGSDQVIRVWDLASLHSVKVLCAHKFPISRLAFQHHLFSYAPGEGIKIWSVSTWKVIKELPESANATTMYCSIDSRLFVHSGMDIKIFNLGNGKEEETLKNFGKVSLRLPGRKVVGISGDNLYFYDLETSKCLYSLTLKCEKNIDVSLLFFSFDLGVLFLAGIVKDSKEGIVLCL